MKKLIIEDDAVLMSTKEEAMKRLTKKFLGRYELKVKISAGHPESSTYEEDEIVIQVDELEEQAIFHRITSVSQNHESIDYLPQDYEILDAWDLHERVDS